MLCPLHCVHEFKLINWLIILTNCYHICTVLKLTRKCSFSKIWSCIELFNSFGNSCGQPFLPINTLDLLFLRTCRAVSFSNLVGSDKCYHNLFKRFWRVIVAVSWRSVTLFIAMAVLAISIKRLPISMIFWNPYDRFWSWKLLWKQNGGRWYKNLLDLAYFNLFRDQNYFGF